MSIIVNANDLETGDCIDFTDVAYDREVNGIQHPVEGFAEALSAHGKFHAANVITKKYRKNQRTRITVEIGGEKFNLTLNDEAELRVLNSNDED